MHHSGEGDETSVEAGMTGSGRKMRTWSEQRNVGQLIGDKRGKKIRRAEMREQT